MPFAQRSVPTVFVNGKFAAQRTTGVQRVASHLVRALDARPGGPPGSWVLLCPPGAAPPPLQHIEVRCVGPRHGPLHLWEQLVLPAAARRGLLLNLAGSAPWFASRQACMVHDAAVFDRPQAYTRAFVWWYRRLFAHLARHGQLILTVSEFSRQRLAACLHLAPEAITVVHNGGDHLDAVRADGQVLADNGLAGQRFLLAVASANPNKNLAALVAAFAGLAPEPGLRLVVVGGRNEQVFAEAAVAADPPGLLRLAGLGDGALKALYGHAIVLVLPSLYEGFGLPALEAMACACPVLASNAAALPEVCGNAALYIAPDSVASIRAGLEQVLGDSALRQRLRQAGAARAAEFRWASAAEQLIAALPLAERP